MVRRISSVILSLSLWLLFTNAHAKQPATVLMIDVSAAPETNSSLQYHLCGLGNRELDSDTTLQLSGGVHHLEEGSFCLLQNLKNFTIQGQQTQPRTVIYCQSETEMRRGIAFFNISSLHLSHLDIINCGREVPTGLPGHINNTVSYLGPLQKVVMIITHSTNVTVESVSFDRCFGFAMLFINPLGKTLISNASVTGTSSQGLSECTQPLERRDMLCSGSGFVIIFNDTDITEELRKGGNYTVFLKILNCYFFNNTNMVPTHFVDEIIRALAGGYVTSVFPMNGGFSIALAMAQNGYFVDAKFINTVIFSNAGNIANFFILYYNMIHMSNIVLDGVVFKYNKAVGIYSRGGGVAIIGAFLQDSLGSFQCSPENIFDLVDIVRSNFSCNSALQGGGIFFYTTLQNVSDVRILVRDTTFTDNVAFLGSAMFAFQPLVNHREIYIYLEDITASGNTFPAAEVSENSPENTGVFVVSHSSNITVVGTAGKGCHFHNNTVSVIFAVRINVNLRGWITFEDNRGFRGGALSLIGNSILFIHNESTISFLRNKAFREGGAIYINSPGPFISTACAIQFFGEKRIKILHEDLQLLKVSITFSNNSAEIAGNSVFGNPLYFCQFIPITSIINDFNVLNTNQAIVYKEVFHFRDTVGNKLSELNSVQEFICLCPTVTFNKSCPPHHVLDHTVIPGDTIAVYLNPVDSAIVPVASLLYSFPRSVNSYNPVSLDSHQDIRPIPGLSHNCSLVEFTIFAPENIIVHIDLFANIGRRKLTVMLNTTSCPPGFKLGSIDSSNRLSCLCSDFIKSHLESTCNMTHYTVARPTNYWVGTRTEDSGDQIVQFVSTCPTDYCREDVTDIDLRVPDQLCAEGRTGTLCGACREGLSSVFGTAECQKCSNGWLAIILLLGLFGIVIVISGLLLDLTITHGLINGYLFYSYIVMVNSNIFLQRNKSGFLFWFLSWANMDSGFPMCFYDGMTEPAKLGLQYLFPTYIIIMIAIISVLSRQSLAMQRILSHLDGIHMLATMLYISFLKLFRTVIDTFTFVSIVSENGEEEDVVWFFDGTLEASNPISVILILLGSLTMAGFILPYVVFFTFSTYIQQWVNSTRLNAFVDANLAPYKERMRFWFGARLILTSIIYVIIANRGTNNSAITLTLEVSLLVGFAIIQAYISPFKNTAVTFLDMFFFLNLIALTVGTSYTIQNSHRLPDQEILATISVSIAFIMYIGIIVLHLLRRLCKNNIKTDQMIDTVTKLPFALKLKIKRDVINKRKREDGSGGEEGAAGVFHKGQSDPGSSKATTGTTTISLQDMVAAPDNEEPTLSQLREPVLELIED